MTDWLDIAFGFDEPEPVAKPAKPRAAPKVQSCCVVVAQPAHEADLGETIDCHFYEENGAVVLCSPAGKPTGEEKRLAPGEVAAIVAKRLKRDAYRREQKAAETVPGFGRRFLRYERDGGVV
jgi:hypothetical protein